MTSRLVSGCLLLSLIALTAQAEEPFYFDRYGDVVRFSSEGQVVEWNTRSVRYQNGPILHPMGTVGMQFCSDTTEPERFALIDRLGLFVEREYEHDPFYLIVRAGKDDDPFVVSREIFESGLVDWAEPVLAEPMDLHTIEPNDLVYGFGVQVHLKQELHGFPEAWETTTGADAVRVAVIDTGVDLGHSELSENLLPGYDVLVEGGDGHVIGSFEDAYHGTAVAGLIAADTNNQEGIAGICWDCGIIPIRLIDEEGTIYVDRSKIYDAFHQALEAGAWVINNSWGPWGKDSEGNCIETPFSEFVAKGLEEAESDGRDGRGSVVVFSAGNNVCPVELQPHLVHPNSVVVSGLDGFGGFQADYSNYGDHVDISAVEGNFTTDISGAKGASDGSDVFLNKYPGLKASDYMRNFRGTSACAPVVSGALALALSANPNLTAAQVRECLTRAAAESAEPCPFGDIDDDGHSPCFGYGRLDAERLVELAASGDCGGMCAVHEDCVTGTYCEKESGICSFGEIPIDGPVDDGLDGGGVDGIDGGPPEDDSGLADDLSGSVSGCSCSTIG